MAVRDLTGRAIGESVVEVTDRDITLYVRSGGSDAADGLTVGTALLTIQEAIDRIPKRIEHNVLIDIGAGDFAGMFIEGFQIAGVRESESSLKIKGAALSQPTLTTGTTTGTTDGNGDDYIDDSGQSWTVGELAGMYVYTNSRYYLITDNTATRLYIAGKGASPKSYTIYTAATRITEESADPRATGYVLIEARDTLGNSGENDLDGNFSIEQLYLVCDAGNYDGISVTGARYIQFKFIQIEEGYYGVFGNWITDALACQDVNYFGYDGSAFTFNDNEDGMLYLYRCAGVGTYEGVYVDTSRKIKLDECWLTGSAGSAPVLDLYDVRDVLLGESNISDSGSESGIRAILVSRLELRGGLNIGMSIHDNAKYGVEMSVNAIGNPWGIGVLFVTGAAYSNSIADNTLGGILATTGAKVIFGGKLIGSGNGGYGLTLETGATCVHSGALLSMTGATADATINDGATDIDWSDHLGSDGDTVVNVDNGCRIERKNA